MEKLFNSSFNYRLIYIIAVPGEEHKGMLKIGKASIDTDIPTDKLQPNCKELNRAAHERIKEYTNTIAVEYSLLYTELALFRNKDGLLKAFYDTDVHEVLKRSGIKKHCFEHSTANEWYECDLETAKKAIAAVKSGRKALQGYEITQEQTPIVFRPEQKEAIKLSIDRFEAGSHAVLWNAKMRFGKTLSALQVVKEKQFCRTLIFTHRPAVDENWFDDFKKIFFEKDSNYEYGSKKQGSSITDLLKGAKNFVYFASIQDLRGGKDVGGKFDKNDEIFKTEWDFVIIDEAHEGTQTEKGQRVIDAFKKAGAYFLHLSGTPFNLLESNLFSKDDIYTWDYVMEQQAKLDWTKNHYLDANPYEDLPTLNIYTYDLGSIVNDVRYMDVEEKAFNFREFFRTWTGNPKVDHALMPKGVHVGDFVHEKHIQAFLNLLCKEDEQSLYPFSCKEYQDYLRHSLWVMPSVTACRAMSKLLEKHVVFQHFKRANVAGEGDLEVPNDKAQALVNKAIGKHPEETYSITLTVAAGRMTTGVTVKPWTAVFYLAGSYNTKASSYMQTIFRVQTPANIGGRVKEQCYVFDFAPDRTLSVLSEAVNVTTKPGHTTEEDRRHLGDFINFCPVIGIDGSRMNKFDTDSMLQKLKAVYVSRVVRNGFDDRRIYNDLFLSQLSPEDVEELNELRDLVKNSKQTKQTNAIDINDQGLTKEERAEIERIKKKKANERTEEEKQRLREAAEKRKQRDNAINTLRAISIRIPMMVYGADIPYEEDVTIDNFTDLVDDESWQEFMPQGITKEKFDSLKRFYDKDVFTAAGRHIRELAHQADEYEPFERICKIINIFETFKNPDKETVLTPWNVVNLHLSETLGGYDFYDENHRSMLDEPRFVDQGRVTIDTLMNLNTHILEINSKSGLYPLYATYSIYRKRCELCNKELTLEQKRSLWCKTVTENVFVVCATEMAKRITRRTLLGFDSKTKANIRHFENLLVQIKEKQDRFIQKMHDGKNFWKRNNNTNMKIDAIVCNPPYQLTVAKKETENGQKAVTNIFHYFQLIANDIAHYTSLIYPGGRWIHRSGKGLANFGLNQINDPALAKIIFYPDANELFSQQGIPDGISIVFKDKAKTTSGFKYIYKIAGISNIVDAANPGEDLMPLNPLDVDIVGKINAVIKSKDLAFLHASVMPRTLFGIESNFVEENPTLVKEFEEGQSYDEITEIKVYTNDKAGKSGRGRWYIMNKKDIPSGHKYISDWKVVVSSANAGGQKRSNQLAILDNHSIFGRSRVALKTFKTQREAQNFYKYAKSDLIRFAFLMTDESLTSLAKQVPDILNYTDDNGLIDFNSDINTQLYKLFDVGEESQKHIKEVLATKAE